MKSLFEALLDNGYPRNEIYNHYSDLLIDATPRAARIIGKWLKKNNYHEDLWVEKFTDQITGKPMYSVAFQYTPYWEELEGRSSRKRLVDKRDGK